MYDVMPQVALENMEEEEEDTLLDKDAVTDKTGCHAPSISSPSAAPSSPLTEDAEINESSCHAKSLSSSPSSAPPSSSSSWQPPVLAPLTRDDVGGGDGAQADTVIVSAPGEASSPEISLGMAGAGRVLCHD